MAPGYRVMRDEVELIFVAVTPGVVPLTPLVATHVGVGRYEPVDT